MKHIACSLINYFKRTLFLVKVEGESAWPFLVPGRTYLVSSILRSRVGDFAVFRNPKNPNEIFVKKVTAVEGGRYSVESTVSWGTYRNDLEVIDRRSILGRLI